MKHRGLKACSVVVMALSLTACGIDVASPKVGRGREPTVAETPEQEETVRGHSDPAVVTLELGNSLREHRLKAMDELPGNIIIPTTNLNAVPITAALQGILAGTDVSLSWDAGGLGTRLVTVMNLSGPLPKVVEKVCAAAKVFCTYRNGSIELTEKETFVVSLPPVARQLSSTGSSVSAASTANSMVDALNELLSDGKAKADEQGGTIVYTTTVEGEERVSRYLAELRTGRPLIVLQLYIWEVTLSSDNAQGINWTQFSLNNLDITAANNLTDLATTSGSVSIGAVTTGVFSSASVASFLATKGRVQTISNPQVTFVSGSAAQLKVGGTQRYISQVGTNVSSTSGTSTSSSTNTVTTDTIDTGLSVNVAGSYENGVVFANLELAIKNLVSLNPTTSGGQTIDLPETTDEKISSVLRVRPGDSLILAGLVSSDASQATQGMPLLRDLDLPMYGSDERKNRELVVIVKPSVVLFSDKKATEDVKKKQVSKPLPDAVVIDKDGVQPFAMPRADYAAPVAQVAAAAVQPAVAVAGPTPELMTYDPYAATTAEIPIAASSDGAPVDKRLMQRGFSRAYDQLLQPAGGSSGGY